MDYVAIGKLVNTHALKGEVRIISDFKYKSRVFVPDSRLYIGPNKEEVVIKSYRTHKNYDMCLFYNFETIEDVLKFKGQTVYINRDDFLNNGEYTDSDLLLMDAYYNDVFIGKVKDIFNSNGYKFFLVEDKYIPYHDNFIIQISLDKRRIDFKNLEGII